MSHRRSNLKILYFGTAAIGIPLLRRCVSFAQVAGVVTSPDRPVGRGRRSKPSAIKQAALEIGVEVYQPLDVNSPESIKWCASHKPDAFVLFAYGQILSGKLLSIPRWAINVHPSLLPAYRGAAPLQRAIMAGETETGITVIQMSERVDAGGILLSEPLPIEPDDTYGDLAEHVSRAVPYLVEHAIEGLLKGELKPVPQPAEGAGRASKIGKEERIINWAAPVREVHNHIRALSPEPLAYTLFRGRRLEVVRSQVADEEGAGVPGSMALESGRLVVQCGAGFLEVLKLKPEGRREMDARAFVNGYRPKANEILSTRNTRNP
ncbi:MAG: methionyl-tRNA formyltransferase [candidate division WOR-3 bacterium]|nr:methionyl-tRNA formyltransferase [candidate division WOR-3 bacterium]